MKLRRYLEQAIISQSEFARAMDVTPAAVCRWLQDLRVPRHDHLRKIKKLTGGKVRPRDFLRKYRPMPPAGKPAGA